jgi:hypothetical protein
MAKIVSFSWTSPAIRACRKTVTRRDWTGDYAMRFKKGDEVIAYDRSPRAGGKPIARLILTADARIEPDARAPDSDYEAEGFDFLARLYENGAPHFRAATSREHFDEWRRAGGYSWVVRFIVAEVFGPDGAGGAG